MTIIQDDHIGSSDGPHAHSTSARRLFRKLIRSVLTRSDKLSRTLPTIEFTQPLLFVARQTLSIQGFWNVLKHMQVECECGVVERM